MPSQNRDASITCEITRPKSTLVPIVISVPHCGVHFPAELTALFRQEIVRHPPDTDWWVQRLYDFASNMGITLVAAHFSRYVIDLNRDPDNRALYHDGRIETGLVPSKTFGEEELYENAEYRITKEEIQRRLNLYYHPYHAALQFELLQLKKKFGQALLFDAHSIKRRVTSIQAQPFPDLILGTNLQKSAHAHIIAAASKPILSDSSLDFKVDHPFQGGYITRHHGLQNLGFQALQLEMSQDLYLADDDSYDDVKAERMRKVLVKIFESLTAAIGSSL